MNKKSSGALAGRLRRMRELGALATESKDVPAAGKDDSGHPVCRPPEGWSSFGEFIWLRSVAIPASCPAVLPPSPLLPEGGNLADIVFLDVETTGLSGGAGTIAFLVGLGTWGDKGLIVEQFFLRDYPGEPEFLGLLKERLRPDAVYVSYNGKSFDTQILRSRFVMNGLFIDFPLQLDLLHPARKLWRTMVDSCSLSSIEEHILGFRREIDVPGIMIPDIYFDFLRSGDATPLMAVFSHHLEDIASLERLLAYMTQLLSRPEGKPADGFQLGRWFLENGFPEGVGVLTEAYKNGSRRSGYLLGRHWKRCREYGRALELWEHMHGEWGDGLAALELAKHHEHRTGNYAKAEGYTEYLLSLSESTDGHGSFPRLENTEALSHRLARIRRKAGLR